MKKCRTCNIVKSLKCFYKDKRVKDGRRAKCKDCTSKSNKGTEGGGMSIEQALSYYLTEIAELKSQVSDLKDELRDTRTQSNLKEHRINRLIELLRENRYEEND